MHFKVFSLKKCYKWFLIFIFCMFLLTISYSIKEKNISKQQAERLIQQVENIEYKVEEKIKEEVIEDNKNKIIIKPKEPTLNIPNEYEGWEVIRKIDNTKN